MRNVTWRELYRSEDPSRARMIATCLEAMEFEARLRSALDGLEPEAPGHGGPLVVEVAAHDWGLIRDVLDDLIAEQDEFDAFIREMDDRRRRVEKRVLVVMVVLVSSLAAVGAIEL